MILWSTYDQAFASGAFEHLNKRSIVFLVFALVGVWLVWFSLGFGLSALILRHTRRSFSSTTGEASWRVPLLNRRDAIAVTYCVAAKGPAIAVPLVDRMWPNLGLELESEIQIPIAVYQTMQIAFGSLMVGSLRRYARMDEDDKIPQADEEKLVRPLEETSVNMRHRNRDAA